MLKTRTYEPAQANMWVVIRSFGLIVDRSTLSNLLLLILGLY
jgi:hypothetical protein